MAALALLAACGTRESVEVGLAPGWVRRAALPTPRLGVGAAELEGKIYVVGGLTAERQTSPKVDVYDPVRDEWSVGPPLPAPVHHPGVVALDGMLWVVGGHRGVPFEPVADVWVLDPDEGRWEPREPLIRARGALATAVVDDEIYALGGAAEDETAVRNVERYDPDEDTWYPLPPLPTPREHLAAAGLGGWVYAIGGRVGSLSSSLGTVEALDTRTLRWETLPAMPTPRGGLAVVVHEGRIHALGGESPTAALGAHEAYDPRLRRWLPMGQIPTPRHGLGAATTAGQLFVIAGGPTPGLTASGIVEALIP